MIRIILYLASLPGVWAFINPDLKVTMPKLCDYICLAFSSFTLQCNFSGNPLFVNWNVPGSPFVDLSTMDGHTVDMTTIAIGHVTAHVDARRKFASYACNVVYPDGDLLTSNTIQEEDAIMSFDMRVTEIQPNEATLMFSPSSHCYNISCSIQGNNGVTANIERISDNPYVIQDLSASTSYEVFCNATRQTTKTLLQTRSLAFTTSEGPTEGVTGTVPPVPPVVPVVPVALGVSIGFLVVFIVALIILGTFYVLKKRKGRTNASERDCPVDPEKDSNMEEDPKQFQGSQTAAPQDPQQERDPKQNMEQGQSEQTNSNEQGRVYMLMGSHVYAFGCARAAHERGPASEEPA